MVIRGVAVVEVVELILDDPRPSGETRKIIVNFCVGVMERVVLDLSLCGC